MGLSINFPLSPEVSAGLHELEPDVSGGISYEDKNLLGLGQVICLCRFSSVDIFLQFLFDYYIFTDFVDSSLH